MFILLKESPCIACSTLTFESNSSSQRSLNRKYSIPMSAPSSINDRTSSTASMANGRVAVRCNTRPDDSVLFHSLKYTTVDTTNMQMANSQRTLPNVLGSFAICSIFKLYDAIKNIIQNTTPKV